MKAIHQQYDEPSIEYREDESKNKDAFFKTYVDADLKDLIPIFIKREQENIILLKKHLLQRDFEAIARIGDMMKGHGTSFGFELVTILGQLLEHAAQQANFDQISKIIKALTYYINSVKIQYF